jgi:Transposase DDE domain
VPLSLGRPARGVPARGARAERPPRRMNRTMVSRRNRSERNCVAPPPEWSTPQQGCAYKLDTAEGRALSRMRKAFVEPVFGQIKDARGFRRFLLRGVESVRAEFAFIALTHNLLKLFRSGRTLAMA